MYTCSTDSVLLVAINVNKNWKLEYKLYVWRNRTNATLFLQDHTTYELHKSIYFRKNNCCVFFCLFFSEFVQLNGLHATTFLYSYPKSIVLFSSGLLVQVLQVLLTAHIFHKNVHLDECHLFIRCMFVRYLHYHN